jgi:hypothetical protein
MEEKAEADAADFVMPEEALTRDRDSVRCEGSLLHAIETKLAAIVSMGADARQCSVGTQNTIP